MWQSYSQFRHHHTVTGTVRVISDFWSPQLKNHRPVLVYLPPSYHTSDKHYPVIYMHDGQNLFDNYTSFSGEWYVDDTMERLGRDGVEAIIVGIYNLGQHRLDEYGPFRDQRMGGGGKGNAYLRFLIETVKPAIDNDFRTLRGRRSTGIMGSSMGGLISLYGFFHCPETFGFVGAMSPSLWFADRAIFSYIEQAAYVQGNIYLDAGTREYGVGKSIPVQHSRGYYGTVRRLRRLLVNKGYQNRRRLLYCEEKNAEHNEAAWSRRLPKAMRFLIPTPELLTG